jgi:DNA-binding LacI/PurR family transcriptional regulator
LIRIPPVGQRWFAEQKLRAMVMGTPEAGIEIASLDLDLDATCFHAASVLAARGKKTIALVRRAPNLIGDEWSEAGMRRACESAGVEAFVYKLAGDPASVIDWLEAMQRDGRLPEGIIACDPAIFMSVYSFCFKQRLRIPEDVAIICRGDDLLLDAVRPTVARYRVNDSVLLNRLWRILLPIMRNQVFEKTPSFLMPDFVPGASAGALRIPV